MRAIGLIGAHDIGTGGIAFPARLERRVGPLHLDAILDERVEEGDRGRHVALVGGDDIGARIALGRGLQHRLVEAGIDLLGAAPFVQRLGIGQPVDLGRGDGPAILAALLDAVGAHLPDVEQQSLAIARSIVDDRAVQRPLIVERILQMPVARADRHHLVAARQLGRWHQRDLRRGRPADDLGQQADAVVEIGDRPFHAIVPGRIGRRAARARTGLAFRNQARMHGEADFVELRHDDRVIVEIERIAERRHEHHHALRPGLMLVIDDLRIPLAEQHPIDILGLGHRRHEAVAVIIVPDIFLVEARQRRHFALLGIGRTHIPVGDQFHAVGIVMREQDDAVVQHAHRFRVRLGQHPVKHLDLPLRRHRLGRVHARVDPDHRLALRRQRARLRLVHAMGAGQLLGNGAILVQLGEVRRRGDDRHPLAAPFRALADVDQLHPVALGRQLLEIGLIFAVVGEIIVGPRRLLEEALGRGRRAGLGGGLSRSRNRLQQQRARQEKPMGFHAISPDIWS